MTTATKNTVQIAIIDGLHVPFEMETGYGPRGRQHQIFVHWGYGYETFDAAKRAIEITESGRSTPRGVRVAWNTGKRI